MAGADIIGSAYIEVLPITSRFQQTLDAQLQRTQATGGFQVPIMGNTAKLEDSLKKAIPPSGYRMNITGNTKPLEDAVTNAVSSLTRKAMGIVGIVSIGSMIISHLKDAVYGFNNVIQQAQIGLETLLGSAKEADDIIESLKIFARETPFQFQDLVKNTQTLVAMGTAGKDVIPTLTAVGDALSGLGRMSSLPRVLFDLGQIRATGRLTGRELMNMAMQGIPVLKYLSEATGKTQAELREAMAKGSRSAQGLAIDSATAISAILTGMENQFGGLMKRQMGTAAGAISNFKDAEQQLLGAIGKPVFDKIIESTVGVSTMVSKLATAFADAGKKGESGLTAVKNAFVEMLPKNAQATVESILTNLGKLIGNLAKIFQAARDQANQWAIALLGGLLKALQGILAVIVPLTSWLARHKEIMQDVVKVYIALKIVETINLMWTKTSGLFQLLTARTLAFATATKFSTAAVEENALAVRAQQMAMASGGGGSLIQRGMALPSPGALGLQPINNTMTAGLGNPEAMATGWGRAKAIMGSTQVQALALAGGLEILKRTVMGNNESLKGLTTITQGVAAGFAIGGPWGAAIGGAIGGLTAVTGWFGRAKAASDKFHKQGLEEGKVALEAYNKQLDILYGTDSIANIDKASKVVADLASNMTRQAKIIEEMNANKKAEKASSEQQAMGELLPNAPPLPDFKKQREALETELGLLQTQALGANARLSPTGDIGGYLSNYMGILAGFNGDPTALKKFGMSDAEIDAITNPTTKRSLGKIQSLDDALGSKESMNAWLHFIKTANENNIDSKKGWDIFNSGAAQATVKLAEAVAAGAKWAKEQEALFQIDTDVATVNKALYEAFQGITTTIRDGKTSLEDFTNTGKAVVATLNDAGKAAVEYSFNLGQTVTQQNLAGESAQQSIIQAMIDLWTSAGKSTTEINVLLDQLGLLERHNKLTIQIDADTTLALAELDKLIQALDTTHAGFAQADIGALAGMAGTGFNIFDISPVNVPGTKGTPFPTPSAAKGGGGKSAAETAAEKAAKALESASKAFYDTIVTAAKDFHTRIIDLMGNPTERIQFAQARNVGALIRNTDLRAAALTSWTEGISKLKSEGLSQIAIDALGLMKGPEMDRQVKRLLQASPTEIAKLNASISKEAESAQKAAYQQQGEIIAKAITEALAKFFADAGTTPGGPGGIQITNEITQGIVDPDALALRIITQLGGNVKTS